MALNARSIVAATRPGRMGNWRALAHLSHGTVRIVFVEGLSRRRKVLQAQPNHLDHRSGPSGANRLGDTLFGNRRECSRYHRHWSSRVGAKHL